MPILKTKRFYKAFTHLLFFGLSLIVAYYLAKSGIVQNVLESTKELTLFTAFISGILFTSIFTTIPAIASLYILGETNNPLLISIIASLGSVVGDLILLRILKREIKVTEDGFLDKKRRSKLTRFLNLPVIRHLVVLLAIAVIASPLPDELGIGILGLINFRQEHFAWLSLVANFLGIFAITSVAHYL